MNTSHGYRCEQSCIHEVLEAESGKHEQHHYCVQKHKQEDFLLINANLKIVSDVHKRVQKHKQADFLNTVRIVSHVYRCEQFWPRHVKSHWHKCMQKQNKQTSY